MKYRIAYEVVSKDGKPFQSYFAEQSTAEESAKEIAERHGIAVQLYEMQYRFLKTVEPEGKTDVVAEGQAKSE